MTPAMHCIFPSGHLRSSYSNKDKQQRPAIARPRLFQGNPQAFKSPSSSHTNEACCATCNPVQEPLNPRSRQTSKPHRASSSSARNALPMLSIREVFQQHVLDGTHPLLPSQRPNTGARKLRKLNSSTLEPQPWGTASKPREASEPCNLPRQTSPE
jgi:hypothetical protein